MVLEQTFTLANGIEIPKLGLGTWRMADAETAQIVRDAVEMGYRHIDTLIHSPQPWTEFRNGEHFFEGDLEAWRALEEAYRAGKVRAIGVSNFERADLANLIDNGSVTPMVNQILAHVGSTPFDLIDYSRSKGVLAQANDGARRSVRITTDAG